MSDISALIVLSLLILLLILLPVVRVKKRKEIILLYLSVTFSLFLGEIVVRAISPQLQEHDKMFEFDPYLGWKFKSDAHGSIYYAGEASHYIQTNAQGFRDSPFDEINSKQKILVIGDSYVSNISVESQDVFTEVMENQLENTSVMNCGVNGYGQVQEFLLLESLIEQYKPDLILCLIYLRNDFTDNAGAYWNYKRPYASLDSASKIELHACPTEEKVNESDHEPFWRFYRQSHLYTLVRRGFNRFMKEAFGINLSEEEMSYRKPLEVDLCRKESSDSSARLFTIMEGMIEKIANLAQDHQTPISFAIAPTYFQIDQGRWDTMLNDFECKPEEYDRSIPGRRVEDYCWKMGYNVLNLLPTLNEVRDDGVELYHPLEQHWNIEGNRVVAKAIINYLTEKDLMPLPEKDAAIKTD